MIRAIAAIDHKRGIARSGGIPWVIPDDLAYYKQRTNGSTIIMGSGTYDGFAAPLAGRRNIVASRSLRQVRTGFELVSSAQAYLKKQSEDDVWIIGGAGLYDSALQYCQELYLTHVDGDFDCDRFFPDYSGFTLLQRSEDHIQNGHRFYFAIYKNR